MWLEILGGIFLFVIGFVTGVHATDHANKKKMQQLEEEANVQSRILEMTENLN